MSYSTAKAVPKAKRVAVPTNGNKAPKAVKPKALGTGKAAKVRQTMPTNVGRIVG